MIHESLSRKIECAGDSYLKDFNLTWKYLAGKKVLDIGGNDGSFAAAAKSHGIDATSVDANSHLFFVKGISDNVNNVGGDVYHLPFSDETFDFVCARYMTPINTAWKTDNNTQSYIKEVMRVVKHGGEFRVLPIPFYDINQKREISIEEIKSFGFSVDVGSGKGNQYYIFTKI